MKCPYLFTFHCPVELTAEEQVALHGYLREALDGWLNYYDKRAPESGELVLSDKDKDFLKRIRVTE